MKNMVAAMRLYFPSMQLGSQPIECVSYRAAWCHSAVGNQGIACAPVLTRSVLAYGCAPRAASGLALDPRPHALCRQASQTRTRWAKQ